MKNVERFDGVLRTSMVATAALIGTMGLLVWWELAAWRQLGYLTVAHVTGVSLCIAVLMTGIHRILASTPFIIVLWGIGLLGSSWAPQHSSTTIAAAPIVISLALSWACRRWGLCFIIFLIATLVGCMLGVGTGIIVCGGDVGEVLTFIWNGGGCPLHHPRIAMPVAAEMAFGREFMLVQAGLAVLLAGQMVAVLVRRWRDATCRATAVPILVFMLMGMLQAYFGRACLVPLIDISLSFLLQSPVNTVCAWVAVGLVGAVLRKRGVA